jgi:2-keto-4-pentenoate hydratase/2-oxohepta-3-ene-1,7-dioic acid hydratase in catechol pathway
MRFVSYAVGNTASYGLLTSSGDVIDLPKAAGLLGSSLPEAGMIAFIAAGEPALSIARKIAASTDVAVATHKASDVTLLAPIPRPTKNVFCIGRNYKEHVAEGARAAGKELKLPEFPQFFTKPPTAVIGQDAPFYHDPAITQRLDYEVELAVIIGKAGRDIPADRAFEHIFGYTILNDVTGRDLQRRHDQWFKGKGLDRSCPLGPYILTSDEVANPDAMELSTTVNGEPRQHSNVGQMIFPIPKIIESLSAGLTLEPGDIIATGTPSGVGYAMEPPRLLKAGDVVVCSITGLGSLRTPIEAYVK